MLRQNITVFLLSVAALFGVRVYDQAINFGRGVYTNVCGSGEKANFHWCSRECNPEEGFCEAKKGHWVQRVENKSEAWGTRFDLEKNMCGKTVTLNVFDHNCRELGWSCTEENLKDYLVWYGGDCEKIVPTPTAILLPTPTSIPMRVIIPSATPSLIATSSATPETGSNLGFLTFGLGIVAIFGVFMNRYAKKIWN